MATKNRTNATLVCPHCGGHETEVLPGGVVAECLNPACGWTFTAEFAEAYTGPVVLPTVVSDRQQELPL